MLQGTHVDMGLFTHYPYYSQLALTLTVRVAKGLAGRRCHGYDQILPFVSDKIGIEIGGPSSIFTASHLIPIYNKARFIDNIDFREETVWRSANDDRRFGSCLRRNVICDSTEMDDVEEEAYDFLIASQVLEHIANPLKALMNWRRVVRKGGAVVAILPDRRRSADHRRPVTTMEHLIEDFERNTGETDMTHVNEVLRLHDRRRDPGAGRADEFRRRCLSNLENRCLHHHVFSQSLLSEAFRFSSLTPLLVTVEYPYYVIGIAQK